MRNRVLHGVSLRVSPGELVCLVGRNGAGKTTTFRAIMGFEAIGGGQIERRIGPRNRRLFGHLKSPTWFLRYR